MSKETVKMKLIAAAKARGIKGEALDSLLSTVQAESGFESGKEEGHKYKDFTRAKSIFKNLRGISEQEFKDLQKDREKFFNTVYSNRKDIGTGPGEGYKARGMGLIQLTGSTKKKYAPEGYEDASKFKDVDYDIKTTLDYYENEILDKATSIEDVTNIVNPNLPKKEKQKRFKKAVAKKQVEKNAQGYTISNQELETIRKQHKDKPYSQFLDAINKFRTME